MILDRETTLRLSNNICNNNIFMYSMYACLVLVTTLLDMLRVCQCTTYTTSGTIWVSCGSLSRWAALIYS